MACTVTRSEHVTVKWEGHGLSVGSEVLGLSSRVRRAAPSLPMQPRQRMVARYGLAKTGDFEHAAAAYETEVPTMASGLSSGPSPRVGSSSQCIVYRSSRRRSLKERLPEPPPSTCERK